MNKENIVYKHTFYPVIEKCTEDETREYIKKNIG